MMPEKMKIVRLTWKTLHLTQFFMLNAKKDVGRIFKFSGQNSGDLWKTFSSAKLRSVFSNIPRCCLPKTTSNLSVSLVLTEICERSRYFMVDLYKGKLHENLKILHLKQEKS